MLLPHTLPWGGQTSVKLLKFTEDLTFPEMKMLLRHSNIRRPGGIRTFPILASAGAALYLFDPTHFVPFTAGLIVLGVWLAVFYRQHVGERDEQGEPNVGLVR